MEIHQDELKSLFISLFIYYLTGDNRKITFYPVLFWLENSSLLRQL